MIRIYEPYKIEKSIPLVEKDLKNVELTYGRDSYKKVIKVLSSIHNGNNVIPVFNGTCATHMAYKALKLVKPNLKKIYVPNNVYVAAWNSILFEKDNVKIVPIDCCLNTWCVDTNKLNESLKYDDPETTDVLIVHNIGGIVNVPELKIKNKGILFIEDNCEGFLGKYNGDYTGTSCLASSVSFYANKTVTCGEGGAFITSLESSKEEYVHIYKFHSQGQTQTRYLHDILAYITE